MTVVRYDPWALLGELQTEMNRLFESRRGDSSEAGNVATSDWSPPIDIFEEANKFTIYADVPGVDPAAIEVHMENGVLSLRGERKPPAAENGTLKRNERAYGTFYRRFSLPDTADAEKITATSRNGVLQLTIPKHDRVQPRKIVVEG